MRVAIVNDLALAVEALRLVLSQREEIEIAWVARDGKAAVDMCAVDTPDLILMDLIMPVMDGVEATRRIMAATPCAILVVTATVEGNTSKVFEAMGVGALDAVNTPVIGAGGTLEGGTGLLRKIDTVKRLIGRPSRGDKQRRVRRRPTPDFSAPPLVVIGCSTGGPRVLNEAFKELPADFEAAIVVVQHVDVQFAEGLASWIGAQAKMRVKLAEPGDAIERGTILIAASSDHLVLTRARTLSYEVEPADYPYRPSVDVFFRSVAANWRERGAAALMTGMGHDGAEGLQALRRAGWHTVAQDEGTSVVFGMPAAAIALDAAERVIPGHELAAELKRWLAHRLVIGGGEGGAG